MENKRLSIYAVLFIMTILIGIGARTNIIENVLGERLDVLELRDVLGQEDLDNQPIEMSLEELDESMKEKLLSEELRTKISDPDSVFENREDRELVSLKVHVSMDLLEDKDEEVYIFPKNTNCEKYYDEDKEVYIEIDEIGPREIKKTFFGYKKDRDKINYSYKNKIEFDEKMVTELKIYPIYEKNNDKYSVVGLVVFEVSFHK